VQIPKKIKCLSASQSIFSKNFEQAIGKSELQSPEREMWLHGITQISQNPVLLKTLKTALEATIGRKAI
jgi:hypothetical protein